MNLESLFKKTDPVVASALDRSLSGREISIEQAIDLFDSNGLEMNMIVLVADEVEETNSGR